MKDGSIQRLQRVLRWQYVASAAQGLLGGANILLLGKILGAQAFGSFSLITAFVATAALFCEARMQEIVVRTFHSLGEHPNGENLPNNASLKLRDYFMFETLTRIFPAVVLVVAAPWLIAGYGISVENTVLVITAAVGFVFAKSGNGTAVGLLRVMDQANLIAAGMTVDWGIRLFFSLILAFFNQLTVASALLITLVSPVIVNFWYIGKARQIFNDHTVDVAKPVWHFSGMFGRLKEDTKLISAQIGLSISDFMAKDLDIVIISTSLTLDKVGIYRIAKYLVQIVWKMIDPFYLALLPEVQRLWTAQRIDELKILLLRSSIQLFAIAALSVLAMIAGINTIGVRFLGAQYAELPQLVLQMSGWLLICGPLIWGGTLAFAIRRPEITLIGSMIGSAVGLTLFFLLVPIMALSGAAIAWSATLIVGFAFTTGVSIIMARRELNLHSGSVKPI